MILLLYKFIKDATIALFIHFKIIIDSNAVHVKNSKLRISNEYSHWIFVKNTIFELFLY